MQKVLLNTILFWGGTPKFEANAKKWVPVGGVGGLVDQLYLALKHSFQSNIVDDTRAPVHTQCLGSSSDRVASTNVPAGSLSHTGVK